jgi:uncharacterized protein YbjT (DUF2867 family)
MSKKILVADAYGNVGMETISCLVKRNIPEMEIIAGVRNVLKYRGLFTFRSVTMATVDFANPDSYMDTVMGVDFIFLIKPALISHVAKHILPFLKAAAQKPVKKIVFLSVQGVEKSRTLAHYKIEQQLLSDGIPYTILRPSFFMQNFNTVYQEQIREGNLTLPQTLTRMNLIDVRDIGEAAASCILGSEHDNKIYELHGPNTMSSSDLIKDFSAALGRKISHIAPAARSMVLMPDKNNRENSTPYTQSDFFAVMEKPQSDEKEDLKTILGRTGRSFSQYLSEYRSSWL